MKHRYAFDLRFSQAHGHAKTPFGIAIDLCLLCLTLVVISSTQACAQSIVLYHWVFNGDTLASIEIPSGFKETQWKYGEGIATTLTYPDSSFFVFQYGVDISLPLLKSSNHLIYATKEEPAMTIKYGRLKGSRLSWCEETFRNTPISIAFSRVPWASLKAFNKSFSTFRLVKDAETMKGHE